METMAEMEGVPAVGGRAETGPRGASSVRALPILPSRQLMTCCQAWSPHGFCPSCPASSIKQGSGSSVSTRTSRLFPELWSLGCESPEPLCDMVLRLFILLGESSPGHSFHET